MAAGLQECVHAAVRGELGGRDKESAHRVPQTHRDPEEKSIQQIPAVIFFFSFGANVQLLQLPFAIRAQKKKKRILKSVRLTKQALKWH